MPADRFIPDAAFAPAPAGARVRLRRLLAAVSVVLATLVVAVVMMRDRQPPPLVFAVAGFAPAILGLSWWATRIRLYRLVGGELRIELQFRTMRFPLAGLVSATPDREAMSHAWKMWGNDGLGAVTGRFRSKRLGAFRACLTDAEHAVVLRWPDRCLVISPQQHSFFVEAVRKRAGLSR
jgi:hypothetical protein